MNAVHKIAAFGRDVYILYMLEMVMDCTILLLIRTFESSKFSSIPDVIYYGTARSASEGFANLSQVLTNQKLLRYSQLVRNP